MLSVVIPSSSGLRFTPASPQRAARGLGRNPFFIRAAIHALARLAIENEPLGRNPFFIRAAIHADFALTIDHFTGVVIPSSSGLRFTHSV